MLVTTIAALVYQILNYLRSGDYLLLIVSSILIILALVITVEVISVFKRKR
jgi:membrane protein YdbS with pleckstrin-like domain